MPEYSWLEYVSALRSGKLLRGASPSRCPSCGRYDQGGIGRDSCSARAAIASARALCRANSRRVSSSR
jgi:hypothetical protein